MTNIFRNKSLVRENKFVANNFMVGVFVFRSFESTCCTNSLSTFLLNKSYLKMNVDDFNRFKFAWYISVCVCGCVCVASMSHLMNHIAIVIERLASTLFLPHQSKYSFLFPLHQYHVYLEARWNITLFVYLRQ